MNDLVDTKDYSATVSSKVVADGFGKSHRNVTRAIKDLECSDKFREENFSTGTYTSPQNKVFPCFNLTREGFFFLVMGFTGGQAASWRESCVSMINIDGIVSISELINSIDIDFECDDKFIYIAVEEKSLRYKVGISKNPVARVAQLQVGNPERLILIHQYKASENGNQSEIIAHKLLKDHKLYGEWFDKKADLTILDD